MRVHETFPEFAVIGSEEVQELVDDDVVGQLPIETE
jgi:hypothetical protein